MQTDALIIENRGFSSYKKQNPSSLRQNGLNALAGMFYVPRKLKIKSARGEVSGFSMLLSICNRGSYSAKIVLPISPKFWKLYNFIAD
jgi:hypothetical protein